MGDDQEEGRAERGLGVQEKRPALVVFVARDGVRFLNRIPTHGHEVEPQLGVVPVVGAGERRHPVGGFLRRPVVHLRESDDVRVHVPQHAPIAVARLRLEETPLQHVEPEQAQSVVRFLQRRFGKRGEIGRREGVAEPTIVVRELVLRAGQGHANRIAREQRGVAHRLGRAVQGQLEGRGPHRGQRREADGRVPDLRRRPVGVHPPGTLPEGPGEIRPEAARATARGRVVIRVEVEREVVVLRQVDRAPGLEAEEEVLGVVADPEPPQIERLPIARRVAVPHRHRRPVLSRLVDHNAGRLGRIRRLWLVRLRRRIARRVRGAVRVVHAIRPRTADEEQGAGEDEAKRERHKTAKAIRKTRARAGYDLARTVSHHRPPVPASPGGSIHEKATGSPPP